MCYPVPQEGRTKVKDVTPLVPAVSDIDEGARVNPFDCPDPDNAFRAPEPAGPLGNGGC